MNRRRKEKHSKSKCNKKKYLNSVWKRIFSRKTVSKNELLMTATYFEEICKSLWSLWCDIIRLTWWSFWKDHADECFNNVFLKGRIIRTKTLSDMKIKNISIFVNDHQYLRETIKVQVGKAICSWYNSK